MSGIIFALATPDLPRKTPAMAWQFRPRQPSRKGNVMWKKYLSWFIATLLLVIPVAPTANAQPQKEKAVPSIEQTKLQVAKLGLGEKARATVTMKDGSKTRGYVYRAGEDDFIIRDRKTDAPTTIRYADVAKVKPDRGHSTAKHLGLGIGIGVGAFLGILLIVFAHLND